MKQWKCFFVLAVLALAACSGKDSPQPSESLSLSVAPQELTFAASETVSKLVVVTSNGDWSATATESWIHVNSGSGSGKGSFSVSVDVLDKAEDRSGSVQVSASKGGESKAATISVKQSGAVVSVAIVPAPATFDGTKRASTTYQLLVYSFADSDGDGVGDFKGIQSKLDYLDALGVTGLWLSPVHPTGSYHAYDVNDYFSLNPLYAAGSHTSEKAEADFKDLIDAAHSKGIAIYMDYVLNHSGDGNAWFTEAVYDPGSQYRDYYLFSSNPKADVAAGSIPMLVSEGSKAYNEGEWYACGGRGRYHFHLDWVSDASVTVTITPTDEATYTGSSGKFIYFGNGEIREFRSSGGTAFDLVTDFESLWGYLVRTSKTSWAAGTKYGVSGRPKVTLGEPVSLTRSSSSVDPSNIALSCYYHSNFAQSMPDLNYGPVAEAKNSPAFQAVALSVDKWLEMGVDGFRLDAVKHIYHNSWSDENPSFLKQWYERCNSQYAGGDIFMVGEVLDSHDMEKLYYKGLPSLFEFGFRDNVLSALKNGNGSSFASKIAGFIRDHKANNEKAITSLIIGNHDITRVGTELDRNVAKEKQAAAMLLTSEGKPFVFQGDELGYWGDKSKHGDADIRMPLCWDKGGAQIAKKGLPDGLDGYTDMVNGNNSVEAQDADAGSLLNVYKTWSRLRNTYPALADGEMSAASVSGTSIAAWYMTAGSQKLLVIHNVAGSQKEVKVTDSMAKPIGLLGTGSIKEQTLTLGANSSVVFEL